MLLDWSPPSRPDRSRLVQAHVLDAIQLPQPDSSSRQHPTGSACSRRGRRWAGRSAASWPSPQHRRRHRGHRTPMRRALQPLRSGSPGQLGMNRSSRAATLRRPRRTPDGSAALREVVDLSLRAEACCCSVDRLPRRPLHRPASSQRLVRTHATAIRSRTPSTPTTTQALPPAGRPAFSPPLIALKEVDGPPGQLGQRQRLQRRVAVGIPPASAEVSIVPSGRRPYRKPRCRPRASTSYSSRDPGPESITSPTGLACGGSCSSRWTGRSRRPWRRRPPRPRGSTAAG